MPLKREGVLVEHDGKKIHVRLEAACNIIILTAAKGGSYGGIVDNSGKAGTTYAILVARQELSDVRPWLPIDNYPPNWTENGGDELVAKLGAAWWARVEKEYDDPRVWRAWAGAWEQRAQQLAHLVGRLHDQVREANAAADPKLNVDWRRRTD